MATIEVEVAAIAVDQTATKNKPAKSAAGDVKPKKAIVKKASTHPSFYEMVSDAIVTLKEKSGSSQYAIQKFTEEKHKQLPQSFRKLLLTQLKKFAASGKLVKVKNSYKLPATTKATAVPKPATKKSSVATKPKPTVAANKSTAKKAVSKAVTKPKTVAKAKTAVKPKSAASKPKAVAAKRKDVKPKAKPAKVAKKSAAASPSSKKAPAKATKKVAVPMKKAAAKPKKIKRLSSVKSPAKRMSARKVAK